MYNLKLVSIQSQQKILLVMVRACTFKKEDYAPKLVLLLLIDDWLQSRFLTCGNLELFIHKMDAQ